MELPCFAIRAEVISSDHATRRGLWQIEAPATDSRFIFTPASVALFQSPPSCFFLFCGWSPLTRMILSSFWPRRLNTRIVVLTYSRSHSGSDPMPGRGIRPCICWHCVLIWVHTPMTDGLPFQSCIYQCRCSEPSILTDSQSVRFTRA